MRDIDRQLINACETGDLQVVKKLIDKGVDVNAKSRYGNTALMYATWYKHTKIVKLLIEKGADVEITNNQGITAISYAFEIRDNDKRQEVLEIFSHYYPEAFMAEYMDRNTGIRN